MAGPDGATAPQVDGAQSSTGSPIGSAGEFRELVKRFPLRQESTAKEREIARGNRAAGAMREKTVRRDGSTLSGM
jgi:hypothetical protein